MKPTKFPLPFCYMHVLCFLFSVCFLFSFFFFFWWGRFLNYSLICSIMLIVRVWVCLSCNTAMSSSVRNLFVALHNLPRRRTSNVNRFKWKNWLYTGKGKKQTIPRTNYYNADDIALLTNTLSQPESLPHSLKRATSGIGLYVNTDKME